MESKIKILIEKYTGYLKHGEYLLIDLKHSGSNKHIIEKQRDINSIWKILIQDLQSLIDKTADESKNT